MVFYNVTMPLPHKKAESVSDEMRLYLFQM